MQQEALEERERGLQLANIESSYTSGILRIYPA